MIDCHYFHFHFHLSHMAVHHHLLYHLQYHHLHLLLLGQSFILNVRLDFSANHFLYRTFPFLPDWFHGLLDHLMFLFCSTAGSVCMVCYSALSRFTNALKIIALSFHFISLSTSPTVIFPTSKNHHSASPSPSPFLACNSRSA